MYKKILLVLGFTLSFSSNAHMQHSTDEAIELFNQLKGGGYTLFFRHDRTNMHKLDKKNYKINDCSQQRNLSVAGIASAKDIGTSINFLEVPINKVYSSPMCRAKETARYLFGKYIEDTRLLGGQGNTKSNLVKVLLEGQDKNVNTAVVAHLGNLYSLFGIKIQEGDAAIIKIENNEPKYIGTIKANQWNDFILDKPILSKSTSH